MLRRKVPDHKPEVELVCSPSSTGCAIRTLQVTSVRHRCDSPVELGRWTQLKEVGFQ